MAITGSDATIDSDRQGDATSWSARVAAVWGAASGIGAAGVLRRIDELVAERPTTDAAAAFESASARDYADLEAEAEPLYRRALKLGLAEPLRGRAVIQLASTLRNLGRPLEAIETLQTGLADVTGQASSDHPPIDHPLADAARAFLALCLLDIGDDRAAVAVALDALAPHLPEYSRAVQAYAAELTRP